ncbi:acyl carrier protein, partial [Escherichia coli]|uniref:acyl carrier protein n=1 Tax=Escherichia coli TaxID=562 RepID=UPI001BFD492B
IGLSSLQKIELLSKLEEHYAIEGDEQSFLALETVGDLRQWLSENKEQLSFRTGAPLNFSAYQGKENRQSGERTGKETYLQEPRWNIRQPVPLLR